MKRIAALCLAILLCACMQARRVPLIGISSGFSPTKISVNTTYADAVRLAGGIPVVLPLVRDEETAAALIKAVDAVIMTGGEDIDPLFFGEEHLPGLGDVNAPRDTSDVLLIKAALAARKPLLGICRGEQVINVVLGGTLYQDLPSQVGGPLHHRQTVDATQATQTISIEPGSRLAGILGTTMLEVNSFHHQAVKDIAPGLTVVARTAEDGVVEAYEGIRGYNVIGVQFHPEAFAQAGDPVFTRIFQDLVRRARKR